MADMDEKLKALREAWLDAPFEGVTDKGNAFWIQNLLNAVSDIVDPDRTLRETEEAQRRGRMASYRSQAAYARHQISLCAGVGVDASEWTARLDVIVAACLSEFGVEPL